MPTEVTKDIIESHIAALSAKGGISSYTDFYDLLLASLKDDGFILSGVEERLMRKTLREKAPLGVTDLDDRTISALKEKPWYLGMLAFIALCAAGGVIEYFVQIPLDHLTGKAVTIASADKEQDDRYLLAVANESEHRNEIRQLVLNSSRFQLVEEGSTKNPPQAIISLSSRVGGFNYKVMDDKREKVLSEGALPFEYIRPLNQLLSQIFPIEGYVILSNNKVLWSDIGTNQGVMKGYELKVYRPGKKVHHPVTGELLTTEESLLGEAFVVAITKDTCRAKLVEPIGAEIPVPGDIVRYGGSKQVVKKTYRKKMISEFVGDKEIVRIEGRITNDTDEPIDHLFGFEGTRDGKPPVIWVEMNDERGPVCEVVLNRGYQVQYKTVLPKPVPPGGSARIFTCIEDAQTPVKLSDGAYRIYCSASNTPAIDYLIIAKLPWGSKYLRADMFPTRVIESSAANEMGQHRPVVVFKTSQPKNHSFAIHIDYWFPKEK